MQRERDRQTHRERQTDTYTHREIEREIHILVPHEILIETKAEKST